MTKRTGYYVTARDGNGQRTAWLCGPFATHQAALAMVPAISYAARQHLSDPRFQFAAYGTAKLTGGTLKPGTFDLGLIARDTTYQAFIIDPWRKLP